MAHNPLVIAIDGPSASGKGTLARRLAKELGLIYLDTGKLYRYVGLKLLESDEKIEKAAKHTSKEAKKAIEIAESLVLGDLEQHDLSSEEIGNAASIVSAIPGVRKALLSFQRDIATNPKGAVLDGRDIGTVVCPNADFKFFITADLKTRAERRYKQLQKQGNEVIYSSILQDLASRDERDTERTASPLSPARDAVHIDTTGLGMDDVLKKVISIVNK